MTAKLEAGVQVTGVDTNAEYSRRLARRSRLQTHASIWYSSATCSMKPIMPCR